MAVTESSMYLIKLLKYLWFNPYNCYKIMDALTFILMLDKQDLYLKLNKEIKHPFKYLFADEKKFPTPKDTGLLKDIGRH